MIKLLIISLFRGVLTEMIPEDQTLCRSESKIGTKIRTEILYRNFQGIFRGNKGYYSGAVTTASFFFRYPYVEGVFLIPIWR